MEHSSLPIIDLAALQGAPRYVARCWLLGRAAREVGFFYLVGHDLREEEQRETLALAARFFALPTQEKLAVQMVHSPFSRLQPGGSRARPGRGRIGAGTVRYHERGGSARYRPTDPSLAAADRPQPVACRPAGMKAQLLAWQDRLSAITLTLLDAFAEVLEQPAGVFDESIRGAPTST